MFVGYARVSLPEQHLALQTDALQRAGCERLYTDTVSGRQVDRPGLRMALEVVRWGYLRGVEAGSPWAVVVASGGDRPGLAPAEDSLQKSSGKYRYDIRSRHIDLSSLCGIGRV